MFVAYRSPCDVRQNQVSKTTIYNKPPVPNCDVRQDLEILNCDMQHNIKASWDDSKRGRREARL